MTIKKNFKYIIHFEFYIKLMPSNNMYYIARLSQKHYMTLFLLDWILMENFTGDTPQHLAF